MQALGKLEEIEEKKRELVEGKLVIVPIETLSITLP